MFSDSYNAIKTNKEKVKQPPIFGYVNTPLIIHGAKKKT